jgi:hypothetical protein
MVACLPVMVHVFTSQHDYVVLYASLERTKEKD